jgi:hypothetical protein
LTLSVDNLQKKVIEPAIIRLVNEIGKDCLDAYYKGTYHWAGTPGQTINSFADFAKGPERLDEMATPQEGRTCVLSPADHWAMMGSQTALYIQDAAKCSLLRLFRPTPQVRVMTPRQSRLLLLAISQCLTTLPRTPGRRIW